jgi:hypothetical protein
MQFSTRVYRRPIALKFALPSGGGDCYLHPKFYLTLKSFAVYGIPQPLLRHRSLHPLPSQIGQRKLPVVSHIAGLVFLSRRPE